MYIGSYWEGLTLITCTMYVVVVGSVWSVPISIAQCVIISECQKVTVLVVKATKIGQKMERRKKVNQNCQNWRENCSKMFFDIFDQKMFGVITWLDNKNSIFRPQNRRILGS